MKKILYSGFVLFGSLSLVAFSPSDQVASYSDLSNDTQNNLTTEVGSFVQSETSHQTEDKTTWNKRHKTWTDFAKANTLSKVEGIVGRN